MNKPETIKILKQMNQHALEDKLASLVDDLDVRLVNKDERAVWRLRVELALTKAYKLGMMAHHNASR